MKTGSDVRIENYSFAKGLTAEEKALFRHHGPDSRICCPFEAVNPQFITIGNLVSINRDLRISVIRDITHHITFIADYRPGLETQVSRDDYLFEDNGIVVGDRTSIGRFCFITAARRVVIGNAVIISDRVYISDTDHRYEHPEIPILYQSMTKGGSVYIGDGSWIGVGATILNCRIGTHCVIGAHSLVTSDIPDYSVAIGSPARVIKRYNVTSRCWEETKGNQAAHEGIHNGRRFVGEEGEQNPQEDPHTRAARHEQSAGFCNT